MNLTQSMTQKRPARFALAVLVGAATMLACATMAEATRRMLAAVPWEHADWKPHEKSMNLSRLATHVAEMGSWTKSIVETDELDFMSPEMQSWSPRELQTVAEIQAEMDSAEGVLREIVGRTDPRRA